MIGLVDFGCCDVDYDDNRLCYANGCICRLNKVAGFQTKYEFGVAVPFRNKGCCHFHKKES